MADPQPVIGPINPPSPPVARIAAALLALIAAILAFAGFSFYAGVAASGSFLLNLVDIFGSRGSGRTKSESSVDVQTPQR